MEIREASYTDADVARLVRAVQQEYQERYGGPDETPLDAAMFDPPRGRFFLGYDTAGEAVASGGWRRREDVDALGSARTAEIKRMYVVPAAQRRGYARAMLAHLEQTAAAAGAEVMILETGTKQPEALALYAGAGYVPIRKFGHYRCAPESICLGRPLTG